MDTENKSCPVCLKEKPRIKRIPGKDEYRVDCKGEGCGRFFFTGPAEAERLMKLTPEQRSTLKAHIAQKNQNGVEPHLCKTYIDAILAGTAD